jgi:uncharacterized protein (TIGR02302 family)
MAADQRARNKIQKQQTEEEQLPPGLRRRLFFAHLTLWWERIWRLAWPLPCLAASFLALALFDVLPLLPAWLHAAVLAFYAITGLVLLWRLRRLSPPTFSEAGRRLEKDSGLPHRPLQTLTDHLEAGTDDPLSQVLWRAEHRRLKALLPQLALKLPAPELARHDPWGLRFASLLLLVIALAGGWHDPTGRLVRALRSDFVLPGAAPPALQVWLTPPAYTEKPPILLDGAASGQPVVLPTGTTLLAMVQGGQGKAQLFIDDVRHPFQILDGSSQRIETTMTREGRLLIRQGRRRIGHWRVILQKASPPSIAFATPPEADREGRLRLDIEGRDVYGIAKAWANIRRTDTPNAAPLTIPLPLGGGHPSILRQAAWHDLTGHPWAGLPVTIEPNAESVAGLRAAGPPIQIVLPERTFSNPVARAVVAQRRTLATTPELRLDVAAAVMTIASEPERFGNDITVYLALSTAASRLRHDQTAEAVPSVIDMLWQTALRIEEGDKPAAQSALDAAARDLEQALADAAPQAEIERLTAQLQTAMERYLDALVEQARRQGRPLLPEDPDHPSISPEDLQGMLDRMRAMSRTGSTEAARQLLSEFRQMLDGLGSALQGSGDPQQARQAQKALQDLQAITEQQRQLLDDTFRRAETTPLAGQPQAGRKDGPAHRSDAGKIAAERQESLRNRLGQMLQSLAELGADVPETLGQAEQAMRDSTRSLKQDRTQDAIAAQSEALARLQEGRRATENSLAKSLGAGMVGQGAGHDPLGRALPRGGEEDDRSVKIPNQTDLQKAREVLDELRRRAGQAERPAVEKDYLQRLLKQFF